jgi:hypothetical protein
MVTRTGPRAGALVVVIVAALALAPSFIDWRIYPAAWGPVTASQVRPAATRTFERTPARLERGEYLADNVLGCFRCHSERDWKSPGAPPVTGKKGAGYVFVKGAGPVDPGKPPSQVFAQNITPDPETGAGRWTDDMLARAIRESVAHDGRPFSSPKFHKGFRNLSDQDEVVVLHGRGRPGNSFELFDNLSHLGTGLAPERRSCPYLPDL